MEIKSWHHKLAKDIHEDILTNVEIGKKYGISDRQVERLHKKPEIEQILKNIDEQNKQLAKREAVRYARQSVKTLVKLQDIAIDKDPETGRVISEEFKFGADVARKAACDLLEMAEVKVDKIQGEGIGSSSIVIVQSGNGNRATDDNKTQTVSDRFHFQQN